MSEEILNQSWVKIQALIVSKTKVDSMSFKTAEAIRDSVCMVIEEFTIDQAKLEGQIKNCNDFLKRLEEEPQLFKGSDKVLLKFMFENKIKELKLAGGENG